MKYVYKHLSRQTFALVFTMFAALNIYSYFTMSEHPNFADAYVSCGFPVGFYGYSGWIQPGIYWPGAIIDLAFAFAMSVILAYIARQ